MQFAILASCDKVRIGVYSSVSDRANYFNWKEGANMQSELQVVFLVNWVITSCFWNNWVILILIG